MLIYINITNLKRFHKPLAILSVQSVDTFTMLPIGNWIDMKAEKGYAYSPTENNKKKNVSLFIFIVFRSSR